MNCGECDTCDAKPEEEKKEEGTTEEVAAEEETTEEIVGQITLLKPRLKFIQGRGFSLDKTLYF